MASMVLFLNLLTGAGTVTVIQNSPFLNLSAGDTARMSCDVTSVTEGETFLHFWNMNETGEYLMNSSRVTVTPNSLIISSVTPNDTGRYICIVRDRTLLPYSGNGTYLSVTVTPNITQHEGEPGNSNDLYLYSLILLVLPSVVFLCWRRAARRGSPTPPARDGEACAEDNDAGDLHYATILHRPAGGQRNEERSEKSPDEVEYATVMVETPRRPITCDPMDADPSNVCYATLKMSMQDARPSDQRGTYPDWEYSADLPHTDQRPESRQGANYNQIEFTG